MSSTSPEEIAAAHLAAGRPQEALAAIEGAARAPDASHTVLSRHAAALKALGRMEDCLAVRRRAAARFPDSGVAWHNLASALADGGAAAEAAEACRKAFAAGLDAPETWLIYGRALAGEGRAEAALAALDEAIRRRPAYAEAFTEKARLVLAVSGDVGQAAAVLPRQPAFALSRAELYKSVGDLRAALAEVESAQRQAPSDPNLLHALAALALETGDVEHASAAAAAALRLAPRHPVSMQSWAVACLAAGKPDEALAVARELAVAQPLNQGVLALTAIAARLAGAADYERLYDYDAFVRAYDIATPPGWADVGDYLTDLAAELDALHDGAIQPAEQTLRRGTQTSGDLRSAGSPAIRAFFEAIDPPIRRYIADLGFGDDPLRARNSGGYALVGAWSNRLASQGHHVDHMHPRGWLSSAFYVAVPDEVRTSDEHAGWLQFGRPSLRTQPALQPAHFVRPTPGRLVLFPSYMWHGTAPFTSSQTRTTIAFDVAPA